MTSYVRTYSTEFARRLNKDGTADSICLFCFATVASSPDETELEDAERIHLCWQRESFVDMTPYPRMKSV
jgi:hypothetical protein